MKFPIQEALLNGIKIIQEGDSVLSIENESKKDKKVSSKGVTRKNKGRVKRKRRRLKSNKANEAKTRQLRSKQKIAGVKAYPIK